MKRRNLYLILIAYLLTSSLHLLLPGAAAWAVPGQNPNRQSSPTRTPTRGPATPTMTTSESPEMATKPPGSAVAGENDVSLPAETVTPLFLTLFPLAVTPRATRAAITPEPARTAVPLAALSGPTADLTEEERPASSSSPTLQNTAIVVFPSSGRSPTIAVGAGSIADCAVMGLGLILLLIGMMLIGERRA